MIKEPQNLRELIEEGFVFPAFLPEKNDFLFNETGINYRNKLLRKEANNGGNLSLLNLNRLEELIGYTVPVIAHDYGAKTPVMWNRLYEKLGLNIRNIMIVADPSNIEVITKAFRSDPKYLGGGFGVGFKEKLKYLDEIKPDSLSAINIVVKENGRLIGYNTDSNGFVKSLEEKLVVLGKRIEDGNFVVVGAGGVAKEVVDLFAQRGAKYIAIVNRTFGKAVDLAQFINNKYGRDLAIGVGENMTRGVALNSERKPCAIINLSSKGDDYLPDSTFFYGSTNMDGKPLEQETIECISRNTIRMSVANNPKIVYADIVLPKSGMSLSLRWIRAELAEYFEKCGLSSNLVENHILDGKPMVIYQAAPAYLKVQQAHPEAHHKSVTEDEALKVFKEAANSKRV